MNKGSLMLQGRRPMMTVVFNKAKGRVFLNAMS